MANFDDSKGILSGMNQTQADLDKVEADAKAAGKKLCVRATDGSDGQDREKWAANGLRFDTAKEAADYGSNLFGRWMGCKGWHVSIAP
jgi:hypothetical protein